MHVSGHFFDKRKLRLPMAPGRSWPGWPVAVSSLACNSASNVRVLPGKWLSRFCIRVEGYDRRNGIHCRAGSCKGRKDTDAPRQNRPTTMVGENGPRRGCEIAVTGSDRRSDHSGSRSFAGGLRTKRRHRGAGASANWQNDTPNLGLRIGYFHPTLL